MQLTKYNAKLITFKINKFITKQEIEQQNDSNVYTFDYLYKYNIMDPYKCINIIHNANFDYNKSSNELEFLILIIQNILKKYFSCKDNLLFCNTVENYILDFVLNLNRTYTSCNIDLIYIFLLILHIDKLNITEENFYKLYIIKKHVYFNNYLIELFNTFNIKNLNISSASKKNKAYYDFKFNLEYLPIPNNITNWDKFLSHIIYYDNIELFKKIVNKIIINPNYVYFILNSCLIEYKLSITVIKYILYTHKISLNLDNIKSVNENYYLKQINNTIFSEYNLLIGSHDVNTRFLLYDIKYFKCSNLYSFLRYKQPIYNSRLLNISNNFNHILPNLKINQIINLYKNYIFYDFSKIELNESELFNLYFEYFCTILILNQKKNKNILQLFLTYTNNKIILFREMYRFCTNDEIENFKNKHKLTVDAYCIINAFFCKNYKIINCSMVKLILQKIGLKIYSDINNKQSILKEKFINKYTQDSINLKNILNNFQY